MGITPLAEPTPAASTARLEHNLAALAVHSPSVARAVRQAAPNDALRWIECATPGVWSAELDGRLLASRRSPIDEADRLAQSVDFRSFGAAAVLGLGLGYHAAALARRGGHASAVLIYEPDLSLMRSVMERLDLSTWLRSGNVFVFTDPDNAADLSERLHGLEALLALGVKVIEHPASKPRLEQSASRFAESLTKVIAATRTQVITTMVKMETTFRNLFMNMDHSWAGGKARGIAELQGAAKGRAAVVVSAGPSLERNIEDLSKPGVRERVVIIAVQTVLKQLLARGIRPHYVTALDYHEISTRFYEGLSPRDVEGVTLVAEPKANPAILDAFPGDKRLVASDTIDLALGETLRGPRGELPPGATVAHLAYALARHLGADPVILIGQDLAFTDGQYYSAGAAIHDVWSTELNPFNTLEMMEWQRIVRWRGHLHTLRDHLDRPVYTDDQMATYLAQFERDFMADERKGLMIIDATEGGARKAHTRTMTLAQALAAAPTPANAYREPQITERTPPLAPKLETLRARLHELAEDAKKIANISRETAELLRRMPELQNDQPRLNRLIEKAHELKGRVESLQPAYALVQRLNQAGAFKRFRADRALGLEDTLDPIERQRRQIERDIMNVGWLAESAESLRDLLLATDATFDGAPKRTRDLVAKPDDEHADTATSAIRAPAHARLAAVIPLDTPADLRTLQRTIARLEGCTHLSRVLCLIPEGDASFADARVTSAKLDIRFIGVDPIRLRAASASIRAGRAFARTCWRGGLGYLSCYDEVFHPALTAQALEQEGLDAALIVGPDWTHVDPALCDAVIERHFENPEALPFVFTQAPPGLAGCVVSARLSRDIAAGRDAGDHFASLGGMLGYRPTRARTDPIVQPCCVPIDPKVRSSPWRFTGDRSSGSTDVAVNAARGTALDIVQDSAAMALDQARTPRHLVLALTNERARAVATITASRVDAAAAARVIESFAACSPGGCLSFEGSGDPLLHPGLPSLVSLARRLGLATHVRTEALADATTIDSLFAAEPDVISIDLHASSEVAYTRLAGHDRLKLALANTERLLNLRRRTGGMPHPWIVPRITRRDAVYEEIEAFFDRGLFFAGACVIDPLPSPVPGERIAPLPVPASVRLREALTAARIELDGRLLVDADPRLLNGTCRSTRGVYEHGLCDTWREAVAMIVEGWRDMLGEAAERWRCRA